MSFFRLKQEWALCDNKPLSYLCVQRRAVEAGRMTVVGQDIFANAHPKSQIAVFTFGCVQMKAGQEKFTYTAQFRHEASQSAQWG